MKDEGVAIAIFAKAPIQGFAKTRLIPRLGEEGAARIQRLLIERAVRIALDAGTGPVSLWCTPDCNHGFFRNLARSYSITLHEQTGNDLGERMANAFHFLARSTPALLMGTDCVTTNSKLLAECAHILRSGQDALFVPVEDGGYIVVGLGRPFPELFSAISWGTPDVMAETRLRAQGLGLKTTELASLWDIDLPEDYERAVNAGLL